MNTITTFKQIKEIIEPIPANRFCVDEYQNGEGQCCFLGHIQKDISGSPFAEGDGFGASGLTRRFLKEVHNIDKDGASVNNDNCVNGYTEPIIKDRLMHMIEDGIKWEVNKTSLEEG